MGDMVTFVCGECQHEQTILWGGGFEIIYRDDLCKCLGNRHEKMRQEVQLLLQNKDNILKKAIWQGYYCRSCHEWDDFLSFLIVSKHLAHTPIYQCKKCHIDLLPVEHKNYPETPWRCERCGCNGSWLTTEGTWD